MNNIEGMSMTEAVAAVNVAGFTLNAGVNQGKVGWFKSGGGIYEVVNSIRGIDGYVVRGTSGSVAPGLLTTPDEVIGALSERVDWSRGVEDYVSIEQLPEAIHGASCIGDDETIINDKHDL